MAGWLGLGRPVGRPTASARLAHEDRDVTRRALPVFRVGRVVVVAVRPERCLLRGLRKPCTELPPLAPVLHLDVRVLDQVVVPDRILGSTAH